MQEDKPPGRRTRKRQGTLDRLVATAGMLFARDGYEAVTMEQIAETADVARATLYNHFPSKEAVLAAWIHQQLAADLQAFQLGLAEDAGFAAGVVRLLDLSAQWWTVHRPLMLPYLRFRFLDLRAPSGDKAVGNEKQGNKGAGRDADGADGLVAFYAGLIRNSQRSGDCRADLDAEHLAVLFHHLYLGALLRWLAVPGRDLRQEFAVAIEVFLQGCACTPGHGDGQGPDRGRNQSRNQARVRSRSRRQGQGPDQDRRRGQGRRGHGRGQAGNKGGAS